MSYSKEKCQRCGATTYDGRHKCPYQDDVKNNHNPDYCNCCQACRHECAQDI